MNTIKNIIVFIALWVFSHFVVKSILALTRTYYDYNDPYIYSLAMAVLIVFVWNKITKKSD